MDTPERNKIAAPPASKFEDSPVFNYINSLSPIQPVRSTHSARAFTSLSFASLPSVFTSPHIKFLNRHPNQDSSKPENPSEKQGNASSNSSLAGSQENLDPSVPTGEASVEPPSGHSESAIEEPQTLAYDHGSPSTNPTPCVVETTLSDVSTSMATYEWESLISDASDLLIFNSPDNTEAFKELLQRSLDRGSRFRTSLVSECPPDDMNAELSNLLVDPDGSLQQYGTDGPSSQPGDAGEIQVDGLGNTALEQYLATNANDKMNNEPISDLHRGVRRRCLDFEVAVAHRKNIGGSLQCKFEENTALSDQHHVDSKPSSVSLRPILPGIGLHLNALSATSKDSKILKCGRQIISLATSDSPTANQEPLSKSFTDARGRDDAEGGIQTIEDVSGESPYLLTEEFNQSIPEKKRLKLEQVSETTETSCKRCNCKKSKCLKLYCECFAAGLYCVEPCSCQGCFNKPIHEDTVLATRKQIESRNPLAFAPKVIRSSDSLPEIGEESSKTPASARHKRGCNCKKSSCLKKYCECYQGGVGCSIDCRCEGCRNIFGRKDGCSLLGPECEQEEEAEPVNKALQKSENQKNDRNSTSGVPRTPLQLYRPMIQLPHSSKGKPPLPAIVSTSGAYTIQKFGRRSSIVRSESKFEKQSEAGPEDEVLQENTSPRAVVKTGSPNSKRVSSSPHCNLSSSPTKRSGRKLILQSIPSFPSLTQH